MNQYLESHYQENEIDYERIASAKVQGADGTEAAAITVQSPVKPGAVANDETQSRKAADTSSESRQQPQD